MKAERVRLRSPAERSTKFSTFSSIVMFTRKVSLMGPLVNHRLTTVVAIVVAALIVALNGFLLYQTFFGAD